jgi:hypothetical protein
MSFITALALGAFLLATWVDVRFASHRPDTMRKAFLHVIAASVIVQLASVGAGFLLPQGAGAAQQLAAVFAVLLPALVYAFLSGLWLARALADLALARR